MIQLTKTQKEIEVLAKRVPQLNDTQMNWAIKRFNHFVCVPEDAKETRCPNCKEFFPLKGGKHGSKWCKDDTTYRCPHCGAIIQVRKVGGVDKTSRTIHQEDFFVVMNVVGEWQVSRLFYMQRYCYIRKDNTKLEFYECCQAWNNPEHQRTYFRALPKKCMCGWHFNPYSISHWNYEHDADNDTYHSYIDYNNVLEPRRIGGANYFDTKALCPNPQILPAFKRMGLTAGLIREVANNTMFIMENLSKGNYKPMYETMLKGGDIDVFRRVTSKCYKDDADIYFTALKICKRNRYNYKSNATEWLDSVQMLAELGLDYHNPYYVCPADIHDMHQRLVRLKRTREDEIKLRKEMHKNDAYKKRIKRYLDMDIHDSFLKIVVLPDIEAFKIEADHLCHCVFRCAYYDKENSLLLSARDDSGKRWETIEVSLRDFTILQSYGYGDKFTERHKEILNLVKKNMWQIRERRLAKAS